MNEYYLVVTEEFANYRIGAEITDPAEIAAISEDPRRASNVARRFAPVAPAEPQAATPAAPVPPAAPILAPAPKAAAKEAAAEA